MNKQQTAVFPPARKFLTTEQLADELGASAKSILSSDNYFCRWRQLDLPVFDG